MSSPRSFSSIRNIIDAFKHFLEDGGGRASRVIAYPPKYMYYLINMYNNRLTAEFNKMNNGSDISTNRTLTCVDFEEIDVVECPCAPYKGCTFYKSLYPIPEIVGIFPTSVTTVDGSISYDYVDWYNIETKVKSRLAPERVGSYYTFKTIGDDMHLYLYSSDKVKDPQKASITANFYNSLDVLAFPICGIVPVVCDPMETPFVINSEIRTRVFESTLMALTNSKIVTPYSDVLNNDNNESQTIGGKG